MARRTKTTPARSETEKPEVPAVAVPKTSTAEKGDVPAPVAAVVILPLRRNGVSHKIGDPVELPDAEFRKLRGQGVVQEVPKTLDASEGASGN
ncbi:hypothetical protein [Roseibium sp.]|uniref:hypothetical protein n=1 Tax=Roseibium sp. TaxID=1936156 RepID=UPI003A977DBD